MFTGKRRIEKSSVMLMIAKAKSKLLSDMHFAEMLLSHHPLMGTQRKTAATVSASHHVATIVRNTCTVRVKLVVMNILLYMSNAAILIEGVVAM